LLACVNDLIFEGVDVVRIGFVIGRTIVMMWLIWGTPIPLSKGGPFEAKILLYMDGPNTEVTLDGFKLETLRGAHDFVSVNVNVCMFLFWVLVPCSCLGLVWC
jgi:hypothetical protein